MRLGLTLTGDQLTMADIVRFACQAEGAGFDSVWVTEAWREAFVPLTAIAMQTNRVRNHQGHREAYQGRQGGTQAESS
jgi:alkanesulfonate monooxygenase SsuD/methylene tetrahydromethanopterin reductase-like flavin-dependent oxidoreductase (luciferase family)